MNVSIFVYNYRVQAIPNEMECLITDKRSIVTHFQRLTAAYILYVCVCVRLGLKHFEHTICP